MDQADSDKHQSEIRCGSGQRHPCRSFWITTLPVRVEGCARPSNNLLRKEKSEQRNRHHAERFAPDVRQRIQGQLAAERRSIVAAQLRRQCVRSFMTCCRKKKNDIPDKAYSNQVGR
jgi:hypothetical protein